MKSRYRAAFAALTAGSLAIATLQGSALAHDKDDSGYTFAVIGDIPYGPAQIASFPHVVDQINADPQVSWVNHLGDIKNGSSVCSDDYFQMIKTQFDRFADPLVYTIGDNEWTDCHRVNNGAYNPLERLSKVRSLFFPEPGRTLGQHQARVVSQADQGIPENVRWERADVAFAAIDVPGSNNSLAPWTGLTAPTPEQTAEVLSRTAAVVQEIHDTFAEAKAHRNRAVTILTQADMFDPTVASPTFADWYGFQPIVAALAREAHAFRGPVYLFNGDSHVYNSDAPLAAGSPWLALYGITTPLTNLSRITVDGSTGVDNYLRVTINPHRNSTDVLSWTRVPFTTA